YGAVCAHSIVLFWTASTTPNAGTISPAANVWIWNLPPVAAATRLEIVSAPPKMVSRLFGKLDARRHLTSGRPWAMEGAASAPAGTPTPAVFRNLRRDMRLSSLVGGSARGRHHHSCRVRPDPQKAWPWFLCLRTRCGILTERLKNGQSAMGAPRRRINRNFPACAPP